MYSEIWLKLNAKLSNSAVCAF